MNTGFLSNPKPSNGYDAILGALAPHAAPAEGTLGGMKPSVHNRVKETFINPVATYPFIARKWSSNWEQTFHAGDLMFVFTGRGADGGGKDEPVHTRRHTILANLPVLNHVLRLAQDDNSAYAKFKDPASWNYLGVMRNSSAASGLNPGDGKIPRGGNALVPDRIINIDVRGSTRMFNYWEGARAGAHLWLAWRELDMGSDYRNSVEPMGRPKRKRTVLTTLQDALEENPPRDYAGDRVTYTDSLGRQDQGNVVGRVEDDGELTKYVIRPVAGDHDIQVAADDVNGYFSRKCWQLLPYTEGRAELPSGGTVGLNYKEVKVWWSDQTIESGDYRRPLCAGWVFQGLGKGELSDSSVAIRQATQVGESRFKLPMIHAFLHV